MFPTLAAPSVEYAPTAPGLHTRAEPVCPKTALSMWLIGPLHGNAPGNKSAGRKHGPGGVSSRAAYRATLPKVRDLTGIFGQRHASRKLAYRPLPTMT